MNAAAAVAANNASKVSKADTKPSVPLMNGIKIKPTPKKAIHINIKSKIIFIIQGYQILESIPNVFLFGNYLELFYNLANFTIANC